jgi:toluene monooxygenase system protein B
MTAVAQAVAYHAVGHRVAAQDKPLEVRHQGRTVPDADTAVTAGIGPMDVVQVGYRS